MYIEINTTGIQKKKFSFALYLCKLVHCKLVRVALHDLHTCVRVGMCVRLRMYVCVL